MKTTIFRTILMTVGLLAAEVNGQITVSTAVSDGLNEPYGVAEDSDNNIYIADSGNNRIVRIDSSSQMATTLAGGAAGYVDGNYNLAQFNNPQGLLRVSIGGTDGLLVADSGNNVIRFVRLSDGYVSTIAGNGSIGPATDAVGANATFNFPLGLGLNPNTNGNVYVYVADWGNNAIRVINLNDPTFGVTNLIVSGATNFSPAAVAFMSTNQIWVADAGPIPRSDNTVKLFTLTAPTTGILTSFIGGNSKHADGGYKDSAIGGTNVLFNSPQGLLWIDGVGLLISDSGNSLIRLATNNTLYGVTNYAVTTFAGTVGMPGLTDGTALASKFNSPFGLVLDPANNAILIADGKNSVIRRIQTGPALSAVPTPQIGWVDFQIDQFLDYTSILRVNSPFVFNNDVIIAIAGTDGTATHYTWGTTPSNPLVDTILNPTSTTGNTPPYYRDGLFPYQVQPTIIPTPQPDITIKAIGYASGRKNSSINYARFGFQVGSPSISGNNAAQFTVSCVTSNAHLYYTIDGSDPSSTNHDIYGDLPPLPSPTNHWTIRIPITTNILFKVRGFRENYQASSISSFTFSSSNFVGNTISFGFANGEASSDFFGSPGQTFYAPVTLSVLSETKMYGLQFNLTVNSGGTNAGPAITPASSGFSFQTMLMKPDKDNPGLYLPIPPYAFESSNSVSAPTTNSIEYPSGSGNWFQNLVFTNSALNLLAVGWLERAGSTNLYDTKSQDLIAFSMAHDDLFIQSGGKVILGGYNFKIPANAANGQTYQIQIGRPTATADGIGAPGSDVFIAAPTNGSTAGGSPVNALKYITVKPIKYLAGSVYPFRWFNAGDFGTSNLVNADVMQVFQSAIYGVNYPPVGSDFFDGMDSCGGTYVDLGHGYLEFNSSISGPGITNPLFDGNDTSINQIAFGDGQLDVCDLYVTYRRSLDPTLTWFNRYWNNGQRVAEIATNIASHIAAKAVAASSSSVQPKIKSSVAPQINFAAGDIQGSAGQVVQIPITATIFGSYPLRVLMLNLTVEPLDGSPALTTPVQFTQTASVLGSPYTTDSKGNGNYSAAWLNSGNAGLTGTVTLGTLAITIPVGATTNSAYAVHFDHASGSPNGLASFPKQIFTGLVTLSSHTNSSYGDGIPDSWRLRWFGTVNNYLSLSNACPSGDGISNWKKYVAGIDPNVPNNFPSVNSRTPVPSGYNRAIHWPTVSGKQYVIERSSNLFSGSWTTIKTNTGTGTDMEFDDNADGSTHFYRVRIVP